MFRFVARWYPLLVLVLMVPIGTIAGTIAGHGDPTLGHAVLPYVYPPWRAIEWFTTPGGIKTGVPLYRAAVTAVWTLIILFFTTFLAMLIERINGRDFGWFINGIFFLIMLGNDISNTYNAYSSSTNYLGEGGIMDRTARKNARKTARESKRKP